MPAGIGPLNFRYNTPAMIDFLGKLDRVPPALLRQPGCVHFQYDHLADYRSPAATVRLDGLLLVTRDACHAVVSERRLAPLLGGGTVNNLQALRAIAQAIDTTPVCLSRPMPLEPVVVPKPWGREIWYTGIEQRGVARVGGLPIAWLLDLFGDYLGCRTAPVLLKILDPWPEPNLGDLYFEMHEQKVEVYVVTHVDERAWPTGRGRIRYGFNQSLLAAKGSRQAFLTAYAEAVSRYHGVRRDIDARLRALKQARGVNPDAPPDPAGYRALLAGVPAALLATEEQLRAAMYRFTRLRELAVGDVVTIAPLFPHALQHGVRVIEFQTPHYERQILSFGQEVLTQSGWDTGAALEGVSTDDIDLAPPALHRNNGQLIADFDDFSVLRLTLPPGARLETRHRGYTIIIGVEGRAELDGFGTSIAAERALYVPPTERLTFANRDAQAASLLIAEAKPGLAAEH